ncbi:hypothetical protein ACET3Z_028267 [Daucus carota]
METEVVVTEETVNTSVNETTVIACDTTVNEADVTAGKANVNEVVPMETEAIVNLESPMETETTVNPTIVTEVVDDDTYLATAHQAIQKEIEDAVMTTVRTTEVEEASDSASKNVPEEYIQGISSEKGSWVDKKIESFDAMRRHMSIRITEVGIDYENGKAVTYKLSHPRIKGHVNHIDFEKEFKNQRSEDTRSIYFFKLRRMIEFLEIDPTVTPKILKPVYEEEQVDAAADDVIDLTADDKDEQPRQPSQRNPNEALVLLIKHGKKV